MGEEAEKKVNAVSEKKMEGEKRPEPKPEPKGPAPAGSPVPVFLIVARVWLVLLALAWGGTIWKLFPSTTWLGKALTHAGSLDVTPSLIVGLAVGLIAIFMLFGKFGSRLDWAKPGQGTWTRVGSYVFVGLIVLFGAYSFYRLPLHFTGTPFWDRMRSELMSSGIGKLNPKLVLLPSAAIFLTALFAVHLLMNRAKWADFLIETQGELVKVSWPPKKEWVGSSFVVLLLTAMMSLFLYLVDEVLRQILPRLGIGF